MIRFVGVLSIVATPSFENQAPTWDAAAEPPVCWRPAPPAANEPPRIDAAQAESPDKPRGIWRRVCGVAEIRRQRSGIVASFLAHAAVMLLLGWTVYEAPWAMPKTITVEAVSTEPQDLPRDLPWEPIDVSPPAPIRWEAPQLPTTPEAPEVLSPLAAPAPVASASLPRLQDVPLSHLLLPVAGLAGGGFEGRTAEARARLVALRGGTPESEIAVERGLAWLAEHQRPDGGWRFDLKDCPCQGRCANSGTIRTSTAATGFALLPFLGAGYIAQTGPYGDVVHRGLRYLKQRMLTTPHGGDLQEGTMYGQGIATIALCEAYAMSGDAELGDAARKAARFIEYAQHPEGGWRYFPRQTGDTTVFGWQLMALKSASMSGLPTPAETMDLAAQYLDRAQSEEGAYYGYQTVGKQPTPTAVGLLSRMYLGWPRDDTRLRRGVEYLQSLGPSRTDMYFNYYATQVLQHAAADGWPTWNTKLREQLIKTQAQYGHERGSWFFHDQHALAGGRLYTTAVCVMILEVYYRHLPLYEPEKVLGRRQINAPAPPPTAGSLP